MADASAMPDVLQDILDSLVSARSSASVRTQALIELEKLVARTFTDTDDTESLSIFRSLQDTFECNVPSRILSWISVAVIRLEALVSRGLSEGDRQSEAMTLSSQLARALSVVQGIALSHNPSKIFLARKYPLEVLIDLLLVSRHLTFGSDEANTAGTSTPSNAGTKPPAAKQDSSTVPLTSAALDTLLCILVDSSPALRIFETLNGVHIVVKILKRANTPRDVRMKCLEFLYFYLMDESPSSTRVSEVQSLVPPLSPSPFMKDIPTRDRLRGQTLRDASSSSDDSYSSNSSRSTSSTLTTATSVSSDSFNPKTPPQSPTQSAPRPSAKPRHLLLRKEVDFVPVTPKKAQVAKLGLGHSRLSSMSTPHRKAKNSSDQDAENELFRTAAEDGSLSFGWKEDIGPEKDRAHRLRTTAEKKEILSKMMGNVDALVEGVQKAGVWGLG
ncbi:CDC14-domain-containing protein [Dentipellis sp. KUC8613]|nr:CDC14-domain-containing protein [Dentipellis sp. KUC8613]